MEPRPIQCSYCRQRVHTPKPNETLAFDCPGCKLRASPNKQENCERSYDSDSSSGAIEVFGQVIKGLSLKRSLKFFNFFKKRNEPTLKTSLNSKPSPLALSPLARPKKRAVLCGVSYNDTKYKLKGTINDVTNIRNLLINHLGFLVEGILVLTEDETEEHIPTKTNIEKALAWLVKDCNHGDSLLFYFSGHGLRQPDFDEDEIDGFDETICPVDFMKEGMILDNYINSTIVRPLKEGVKLHAIVDACHSGTVLDLKYVYNRNKKKWDDNSPPSGVDKSPSGGGLAICFSACEDNKVASDTSAFTGNTMNGVMTYILVDLVKQHRGLTYGDLFDMIQDSIDEFNSYAGCLSNDLIRRIFNNRITQKPILSSSEEFDVYSKHFIL